MSWRIRHAGSPASIAVRGPDKILAGLRDGDWEPGDEVQTDNGDWMPLEDHPAFAEACENLEGPKPEPPDESRIDMNPMIDVALVLLIFFILTTTYSSLRRSIDLPEAPTEKKGAAKQTVKPEDIKERFFKVKMSMDDDGKPVVLVAEKPCTPDDLEAEILGAVRATGKREVYADIAPDVPWGLEAKLYDACRGADIRQIYWPKKKS
jgi:biopolymer transport protein ExbD